MSLKRSCSREPDLTHPTDASGTIEDCYRTLATSVIASAFVDMLIAMLETESWEHPECNKQSARWLKKTHNTIKKEMHWYGWWAEGKTKEQVEEFIRLKTPLYIELKQREIKVIEGFFRSDLFSLYSEGAEGEYFIDSAKRIINDFKRGKEIHFPNIMVGLDKW